MKHDSHREILDDLYGAPGAGPDCDSVLGMVRAHRAARRRRRATAATALMVALAATAFFLRERPAPPKPHLAAIAPQMRQIDDDELLDMMDGQPAAIATMPDGSKRLLVIVKAPRKERLPRARGG